MAVNFPDSPSNNDEFTSSGVTFRFSSATNTWSRTPGVTFGDQIVAGDGISTSVDSSTKVVTITNTKPDNTGKAIAMAIVFGG